MAAPRRPRHCSTCQCSPYVPSTLVLAVGPTPTDPRTEIEPAQACAVLGHDYSDRLDCPEDGTYGWRACSCGGAMPGHNVTTDPAGGDGCGMAYRLCRFCDHVDERPLTEGLPAGYGDLPDPSAGVPASSTAIEVQLSGSSRQEVPAELALPTDTTHTSGHMTSKETAMVEHVRPVSHRPEAGAA